MLDWLVITADQSGAGRGVRGYALVWFLHTYFGWQRVGTRTPEQVRRGEIKQAESLFLGLPTSLSPNEIRRLVDNVQPRRFVVFDYLDRHELAWTPEQEAALRELTDRYFKPWSEPGWNFKLRMGLLPLRTNGQLYLAIAWDRAMRKLRRRHQPSYDVVFLGRPNTTCVMDGGEIRKINQRVSWLQELKSCASDLTLGGGLTEWDTPWFLEWQATDAGLAALRYPRPRVTFPVYWHALQQGRALLSPGGNAPWTYRHYECLYAGGVVVSIDFRERDMLVPLPRARMVHVADGAPVVPAVREALELHRLRPDLAEENFAHLERYLHFGSFAKSRRPLIDRFMAQFA